MKGIIYTEWGGINLAPLTKICSEPLFPLGGRPVIDYLLKRLKLAGVDEVVIILHERIGDLASYLGDGKRFNIRINYICQNFPLGRGGVIRAAAEYLDDKPFLLADSNAVIDFDLLSLIGFHKERGSSLTIGVNQEMASGIDLSADGRINLISRLTDLRGCGIYILDPSILHFIKRSGYLDIEDQLTPLLISNGVPVYLFKIAGYIKDIELLDDYITANWDLLEGKLNGIYSPMGNRREIMDRVWVGKDVTISPDVRLTGPVIIGDNTVIDSNCEIIGPAVIGEDCHLKDGVFVEKSIILTVSHIVRKSEVGSSVVGKNYLRERSMVYKKIAIKGHLTLGESNLIQQSIRDANGVNGVIDESGIPLEMKRFIYLTIKRALDIIASTFVILFGLPIFLMIALAVKIDSKGPAFFLQKRCARGGKRFTMIKFRSMIFGAADMQEGLRPKNDLDGPVFKIEDDPRLTRIGRFLRRTSLDELPQFFNVLIGDMSLVGPRPLVMEEMRCSPEWREIRLRVKPGITGLWQMSSRSSISFHDWIRHDIHYVKNQSILLDIKIIFKTIWAVIKFIGVY